MAVQRRHMRHAEAPAERKVQVVDVIVKDVEVGRRPRDTLEHDEVPRDRIDRGPVPPQRLLGDGDEPARRGRVAARKQRDVVAGSNQRLGEVGDDAFRAAVLGWRNAFVKRRDLGDPHTRFRSKPSANA